MFEDGCEDESESNEAEKDADVGVAVEKGCWIKLEIHYQELAEDQTVTFPVSVVAGSIIMPFGENTGSVKEVRAKWTEEHPEYTGCLFHYDDKQDMLIPFMRGESEIKGRIYKLPVTVGYLHQTERYDAQDFGASNITEATQVQIRELYSKKHPEFENAIFAYIAEINHLFPILNFPVFGLIW